MTRCPPPEPPRHRLPSERSGVNHHVVIYSVKEREKGKNEIVETDLYITLSEYADGSPAEIFTRLEQAGSRVGCLVDAWCTAVSVGLQYGIPLNVFTDKARGAQYEPRGRTTNPSIPVCTSPLDYIARWLSTKVEVEGEEENEEREGGGFFGGAPPGGHDPFAPP